jgi:hypothetical protein
MKRWTPSAGELLEGKWIPKVEDGIVQPGGMLEKDGEVFDLPWEPNLPRDIEVLKPLEGDLVRVHFDGEFYTATAD